MKTTMRKHRNLWATKCLFGCLAIALVLLVECSGAVYAEEVTLRIMQHVGADAPEQVQWWHDLYDEFYEETGIRVEMENIVWGQMGYEQYVIQTLAGQGPDVACLDSMFAASCVGAGLVHPLNDLLAAHPDFDWDDFIPPLVQGVTYDGQVWAIPGDGDWYMAYYNKTAFDEAGMELPRADWTWDDYYAMAQKLTLETDYDTRYGSTALHWEQVVRSDGADVLSSDGKSFGLLDQAAIESLQWVFDFNNDFDLTPSSIYNHEYFVNQESCLHHMGSWAFFSFDLTGFETGIQVPPTGSAGKVANTYIGAWLISSATEHLEEAWEFMSWVNSKEVLTKRYQRWAGCSARMSVCLLDDLALYDFISREQRAVVSETAQYARTVQFDPKTLEVMNHVNRGLAPAAAGLTSAWIAVEQMTPAVQLILDEFTSKHQ